MGKVIGDTEPRAEASGAVASVESMLNSRAFRERLEAARRQREMALDLRREAAPDTILAGTRPWEHADPAQIRRRREQMRDAAAAPGPGADRAREGGVRDRSAGAATDRSGAGPRPGFGSGFGAAAGGMVEEGAKAPQGAGAAVVAASSVYVLRPASKPAIGAKMARAAAAMAALAASGTQGAAAAGRAGAGAAAEKPEVAAPAPVAVPPAAPRRSRAVLAAGGFALGLTLGAALSWVLVRPAAILPEAPAQGRLVNRPDLPAPALAPAAATRPATPTLPQLATATVRPVLVVDVAARAPMLAVTPAARADRRPDPSTVLTPPPPRLAPAVLPPVAAAPGPIPHLPDRLAAGAGGQAEARPDAPPALAPLRSAFRQVPTKPVAIAAAGAAPRVEAAAMAPRRVAAPRAPAPSAGETGQAVFAAAVSGGPRRFAGAAPVLAVPPSATLSAVPRLEPAAAVPLLAGTVRGLPRPGAAAAGGRVSLPGAGADPVIAGGAAARVAAALADAPPRVIPPSLMPPRPTFAGLSVHIHAPGSIGNDALDQIAADLADIGFAPAPPARVGITVRNTQVRFFHDADAEAAATLAGKAGAVVRDFTSFRPSPPDGTLELWLAGGFGAGAAAGPARVKAPSDPLAARKRALRDLLVEQLRRGDHL